MTYSSVWTRWYSINMSSVILPYTSAVFVVGSTLIYCYDRPPTDDTNKLHVKEGWNATKSSHPYHTYILRSSLCILCTKIKYGIYILKRNIFVFLLQYGHVKNSMRWYYLCDTYYRCISGAFIRMFSTQNKQAENDIVLVWTSKLTYLLCGWSKQTRFQRGDQN